MDCPKALIFDLDETLARSFEAPEPSMLRRLEKITSVVPTAIMTGAGFDRIQRDILSGLHDGGHNLYIFPNSSAQCFIFHGEAWTCEYSHLLTDGERSEIKRVLTATIAELPDLREAPATGEQIVDREAQIAYTAVGTDAPRDIKTNWDPTAEKRLSAARILSERLPSYDILVGGASTIDFTRKNVNKAFGVKWFAEYLKLSPQSMLYVGDALFPGGNDQVVIPTGIQTRLVKNPAETELVIDELLEICSA